MRKCAGTVEQLNAIRERRLIEDLAQNDAQLQIMARKTKLQVVQFIEDAQRAHQRHNKLSYELQLLRTRVIYVHIMTDYEKNRIVRVTKDDKPKHHDTFSISFTRQGQIRFIARRVELALRIETSQVIDVDMKTYMITPFLSRSEANSFAQNSIPPR